MRLSKFIPVLSVVLALAGCSSIIDGATQTVRIDTPGATEAECHLTNGVKYRVVSGETARIQRTHRDLVIDCYASGNRHKQVIIPSALNEWGLANVSNAVVPGVTYDHYAGGLYAYPPVITIDFVGIPTRGFETPAYHNKDAPNPYKQSIESYGASVPKLPADAGYEPPVLKKRDNNLNSNPFSTPAPEAGSSVTPMPAAGSDAAVPAMTPTKPNISGSNAEELTRSANPSVFNN